MNTIFHDISQWQGNYNMADGSPIVAIKMSGGDAGLYYDSKASLNYNNAVSSGKTVIGYHFAGGTDPIHEADFFIRAMSPLAENDILCLDWEVSNPDPVGWCTQFVNHVHEQTGVWPLIYMNTSTCTSHDWSPVLANCGLWIADYRFTPDQDVPCGHPYIIHQYTSSPIDTDACFISVDDLKKYGYHAPVAPAPTPEPAPEPVPTPSPEPTPAPSLPPQVPPIDTPPMSTVELSTPGVVTVSGSTSSTSATAANGTVYTSPPVTTSPEPVKQSLLDWFWSQLNKLIDFLRVWKR